MEDADMTDQQTRGLSTADLASTAQGSGTRTDADEPKKSSVDTENSLDTVDTEEAGTRSGAHTAHTADRRAASEDAPPLFEAEAVTSFRGRWQDVQTGFVDDPRRAVRDADELVAAVISALASSFAEHKGELEAQWRDGEPATEELRVALRRYRSFFDQLIGS
jgi:CHAD domain-containing protein